MSLRIDLEIIQQWIQPESNVLDLGCGDGTLLSMLSTEKAIEGYGLEIDADQITACIAKGVNVIEADMEEGLGQFADDSFDTVLMTQALQVLHQPDRVLEEMLRIGNQCIVTFPNFANWRARLFLTFRGKMPVTRQLSYQWYNTPNIHFCTVSDFEILCKDRGITILNREFVAERSPDQQLQRLHPNLFCDTAIYHLSRNA